MKDLLVVIKKGKQLHNTLACLKFDRYGQRLCLDTHVCDSWKQGYAHAKNQNQYKKILFINSGTIILDWQNFIEDLQNYPFKGLIGHLIFDSKKNELTLHDQAFLLDISTFPTNIDDYNPDLVYDIKTSETNIHHDYTPLWAAPNSRTQKKAYNVDDFLQKILFFHLNENKNPVFNWHQNLRNNKIYLYNTATVNFCKEQWNSYKFDYTNIAEHQLWIFNNEKIPLNESSGKLLTPGSGLFWILSLISDKVESVTVADISKTQIDFVQYLVDNWNGIHYGEIVVQFIKEKNVKHFQVDNANLTQQEKIQFMNKKYLSNYINLIFENFLQQNNIKDFAKKWTDNKKKLLTVENCSLITMDLTKFDTVWCSNILNYKWTYLNHTEDQYNNFKKMLVGKEIK